MNDKRRWDTGQPQCGACLSNNVHPVAGVAHGQGHEWICYDCGTLHDAVQEARSWRLIKPDVDVDPLAGLSTVIIQFKISGALGSLQQLDARHRIERALDHALIESDNGFCDGGQAGAGSAEVFLYVKETHRALATIKQVLTESGYMHWVHRIVTSPPDVEDAGYTVVYPEGETYFSMWQPDPPKDGWCTNCKERPAGSVGGLCDECRPQAFDDLLAKHAGDADD